MGADPLLHGIKSFDNETAYVADPVTEPPFCRRNPPCGPPKNEPSAGGANVNCQSPESVTGI
jgi:hypothetical protein